MFDTLRGMTCRVNGQLVIERGRIKCMVMGLTSTIDVPSLNLALKRTFAPVNRPSFRLTMT